MTRVQLRTIRVWLGGASAAGVATLFLPFAWRSSPLEALFYEDFRPLALTFFLAPVIGALTLRWWLSDGMSRAERTLAIALGIAGAVPTALAYTNWTDFDGSDWRSWMRLTPLILLLACVSILGHVWRSHVSREVVALQALVCGYLANSAFCLFAFADDWEVGAWFALATSVGYATATLRIWTAIRTSGGPVGHLMSHQVPVG